MFLHPMLALLPLLLSLPCTSTNLHRESKSTQSMMRTDPGERETLFLVMEALSSDRDWRAAHPDPCRPGSSWPGIECKPASDNHLHVSRLLFGTPPTSPSCKKTATFPSEIFNLPHLQSLLFLNCFTTTKTTLSIPLHHSHSSPSASLQQLSLKSNPALVGTIPPQIASLTSLQVLTLSQNRLSGRIPVDTSGLKSLIHLDLSYNSLTGSIPARIGEMRSLVDLDLSYNTLTGTIPPSIGQLGLLQKLDLSSNSLTGAIPDTIESLSSLSMLALSSNKLSGQFPKGLARLQNLQYLIMDNNPVFVPLPFQLGRLARLQELRLANSGYSGPIPGSFAWLSNLTTMSLENNRLSGEIPAALSGLGRIYHLNLSRNQLGGVVPFNAGFFRRLGRNMDLSGNPGLCLRESESSEGIKVGVAVCGAAANSSGSPGQAMSSRSEGAPSLILPCIHSLLGIWGLYQSLV